MELADDEKNVTKGGFMEFPWLIAHRGAMAEAPENSCEAFDLAFSGGADGIEFDIQLTADHVPVVFHDDTMDRTAGIKKGRIFQYTLSDLRQLDLGSWFSDRHAGCRIMTLEEVLKRYYHKALLMIELKSVNGRTKRATGLNSLPQRVVAQILEKVPEKYYKNIFLLSFDPILLASAHELLPGICCMLNIRGTRMLPSALTKQAKEMLWGYCLPFKKVSAGFVKRSHEAGKTVAVYSCNHKFEVLQAMEMGIDVIMTDDPARVAGAFKTRRLAMTGGDCD